MPYKNSGNHSGTAQGLTRPHSTITEPPNASWNLAKAFSGNLQKLKYLHNIGFTLRANIPFFILILRLY